MNDKEHQVRERAYSIWEKQGKPEGQHKTHWDAALKELGLKDPANATALASGVVDSGSTVARPATKRAKKAKSK